MSLFSVSLKCFIIIVLSLFLGRLELWKKISPSEKVIVGIGILSARENFIQRETVRSTWLKEYLSHNSESVKAWFVVGNSSCYIPPQYRLSYYSCEKWNLNVTGLRENFFTSRAIESGLYKQTIHQGFSFKVNHPIIVTRLGVFYDALVPNTLSKVAIMDIQSKEIIVQATFLRNMSSSINGFIYSPVEKVLFPKDYEGLVIFEGYMQHLVNSTVAWNDGGGVITFKRVYSSPHHIDSKKYTSDLFTIVSIEFHVDEIDHLKEIIKKEVSATRQWHVQLQEIQDKIDTENTQHGDLLIVDSLDVYRNLPIKLLKFYQRLQKNKLPLYIIKTDDDSIINVKGLLKEIQENSKLNPDKLWLWSRFRKDWPVNYIGKWADYDYKSVYYPSFPCGAAYVISRRTLMWLSSNAEILYPYQGEDVSIGIWLSAINPDLIEDENFECGSNCNHKSYNRAQLSPDEMYIAWSNFEKCQNLCSCDEMQNFSII